jgi:threonine 3-dehydrogenase
MLALQKTEPKPGLTLAEVPEPAEADDEVLIAVKAAGICGSDLHVSDWAPTYGFVEAAMPVTLGHEFAGVVIAVGSAVSGLSVGDRVVVMPSVTCGRCAACRDGDYDRCTNRKGLGLTRNGGFAAQVAVPALNCVKIPEGLSFELAALTEPLTVSGEAVRRGGAGPGSTCLVMGPGTIGQGIALLARHNGAASVTISGMGDVARFETLRALGFDALVDMADADSEQQLRDRAGEGFDVVFEATGAAASIVSGLALLRPGGTLVVTGIHSRPVPIDGAMMVRRALNMVGSYRSPRALWPDILALLAARPDEFAPMITHRLPLAGALEGFALAHRREGSKIMLMPDPAEPSRASRAGSV